MAAAAVSNSADEINCLQGSVCQKLLYTYHLSPKQVNRIYLAATSGSRIGSTKLDPFSSDHLYSLELNQVGGRGVILVSPLTTALLFGQMELFQSVYVDLFHKERKMLERLYNHSKTIATTTKRTLWSLFHHDNHPLYLYMHKKSEEEEKFDIDMICSIFAKIYLLVHKYAPLRQNALELLDFIMISHDPWRVHNKCVEALSALSATIKNLKWPVFLPPRLKLIGGHGHDSSSQPSYIRSIFHEILQTAHPTFFNDVPLFQPERPTNYFDILMQYLDHKIRPFMRSLNRYLHTATTPRSVKKFNFSPPVKFGYVYAIQRHCCAFDFVDKYCRVKFHVSNDTKEYTFIMRRDYYETEFKDNDWIFIRHGVACGPQTHPWIAKFFRNGYIRKMKFKLLSCCSDGILINWKECCKVIPNLMSIGHGCDLSQYFGLYRRIQRRSKTNRHSLDNVFWQNLLPFPKASVLNVSMLSRFSPHFHLFSQNQRYMFYMFFWNILTEITISSLPRETVRFFATLIDFCSDWNNAARSDIMHIMPPHRSTGGNPVDVFWNKWSSHMELFSVQTRALAILGSTNDRNALVPLLSLSQKISEGSVLLREVVPALIQLVSHLHLSLLPIHNDRVREKLGSTFSRMLYTDNVRPEMKRVVWQSLVLCRSSSVSISYGPVVEDLFKACPQLSIAIPMLFPLDPMITRTVTINRETGLMCNIGHVRLYHWLFAEQVEFAFENENGRGPSVQYEVLNRVWKVMLEKRALTLCDEDNMGCLNISAGPDILGILGEQSHAYMFTLGFVSGVCLMKGLFLPYPIHIGLWRYLNLSHRPMSQMFSEHFQNMYSIFEHLSNEDISMNFGLSESDIGFRTRSELVEHNFLPSVSDLEVFKNGWEALVLRKEGENFLRQCNSIFCEPKKLGFNHA